MVKTQCYSKLQNRTRNVKLSLLSLILLSIKCIKLRDFFSDNTKREVKISADTLVLCTHDNIDFSPHLTIYIKHSS